MYTISRLKSDVAARLHGTTVNSIQNFYGLCNAVASDILLRIDPQETKRIVETPPIFNGVWNYAIPVDLKGNRVIDIRPQFLRYPQDVWLQVYNQAFDLSKNNLPGSWQPDMTIVYDSAIKYIRISSPNLVPGIVLSQGDNIQSNGTWSTGGDATNLQVDNINFVNAGGSLKFNLTGATGTGYLENSTLGAQNLQNNINQAVQFLYSYFPTGNEITSMELRWGSGASDYYSVTTSVTQENTTFQNAWNLLAFNWLGATVVGSPDVQNITYLRVTWNYTVGKAQTGMHLNGISSILGKILEMEYYSKYMFRDQAGTFKETVTSDTDIINLDTEAYMIFTNRFLYLAAQQKQGSDMGFDFSFFDKEYENGIARYTALYKSEVQKPRSTYYQQPYPTYTQYLGRWKFF